MADIKPRPEDVIRTIGDAQLFLEQAVDLYWAMDSVDRNNSEPMKDVADHTTEEEMKRETKEILDLLKKKDYNWSRPSQMILEDFALVLIYLDKQITQRRKK